MINGVEIKKLKWNADERGRLMELLRSDDGMYNKFGQVYVTTAYPQVVKAWHYHKIQDDFMAVAKGMMKIVLFDDREGSPTRGEVNEFFVGDFNPMIIKIPKNVYHGFKCISEEEALVVNIITEPYNRENPDEFRLPWNSDKVPYDWERKNG